MLEDDVLDDVGSEVDESMNEIDTEAENSLDNAVSEVSESVDSVNPVSSGSLPEVMGSETVDRDGIVYNFTVLPGTRAGTYRMKLDVINTTSQRQQVQYRTSEHFDFSVMDGENLLWNYNSNRFFVQSEETQTINPGETLSYEATWDPVASGDVIVPGPMRFIAEHKRMTDPVRVEFALNLN